MNQKPYLISLITVLILVSFLSACVGSSKEAESNDGNDEEGKTSGVTLNVITVQDPFFEPLKKLIPEFETNTGIEVNLEGVEYNGLRNKIVMDVVGGSGSYDVVGVDNMWTGEFADGGYVIALDEFIERDEAEFDPDDIPEPVWGTWEWKGEQFAVPFSPYAKMTLYRKDLWEDPKNQEEFKATYGYDLKPPETWDQFRDMAEFFTGDWGDGQEHYGVAFNAKRGASIVHMFFAYANTFGAKWFKSYPEEPWDFTPTIDSSEIIESLEYYVSLREFAPPEVIGFEWFDTGAAFWNGQVAMMIHWNVYASMASDPKQSKIVGKIGAALPPGKDPSMRGSQLGGWGWGISTQTDKVDAAWEFVKWATSKETMLRMVTENSFDAVSRISVLTNPEVQEKYPWAEASAEALMNADPEYKPRIPAYVQMEEVLGVHLNDAVTGKKTPAQALKESQEQIEEVLKDAGLIE